MSKEDAIEVEAFARRLSRAPKCRAERGISDSEESRSE